MRAATFIRLSVLRSESEQMRSCATATALRAVRLIFHVLGSWKLEVTFLHWNSFYRSIGNILESDFFRNYCLKRQLICAKFLPNIRRLWHRNNRLWHHTVFLKSKFSHFGSHSRALEIIILIEVKALLRHFERNRYLSTLRGSLIVIERRLIFHLFII
jgi:hypothetical protein